MERQWAMGHNSPSDGFERNPKFDGFETGVSSVSCFHLNLHFSQIFRKPKYPRPISFPSFITEMTENVTIKNQNQNGDINVPIKVRLTRDLKSYIRVRFYPTHLAFHWCLLQFSSTTIDHGLCPWGQCRVVFGGAVGAVASRWSQQKWELFNHPSHLRCQEHEDSMRNNATGTQPLRLMKGGSGCKWDFDTSELFLRASMDFPCVSSGPQCCWTLLGVVLFKPLRIYSFHNLNLTKLANCRKAPNLDGDWWLGHCKIMFVKNSPKPACRIKVSKPSSHTSPTCALVHGKSSKTQPCCKTSGESSRKRIAWMTSESTRNAERTCLEVLSKQNKVDLPQYKRSFPWTELDAWTPKAAIRYFKMSKNGKLHFHQLAFFRSFESLTTSWGSSNMPRKVGVPVPMRSPRVVITQVVPGGKSCTFKMCRCCCLCFIYSAHICTYMYMYVYVHVCKYHTYVYIYMIIYGCIHKKIQIRTWRFFGSVSASALMSNCGCMSSHVFAQETRGSGTRWPACKAERMSCVSTHWNGASTLRRANWKSCRFSSNWGCVDKESSKASATQESVLFGGILKFVEHLIVCK